MTTLPFSPGKAPAYPAPQVTDPQITGERLGKSRILRQRYHWAKPLKAEVFTTALCRTRAVWEEKCDNAVTDHDSPMGVFFGKRTALLTA